MMDLLLRRRLMMLQKGGGGRYVSWIGTDNRESEANTPSIKTDFQWTANFNKAEVKFLFSSYQISNSYVLSTVVRGAQAGCFIRGIQDGVYVGTVFRDAKIAEAVTNHWYIAEVTPTYAVVDGNSVTIDSSRTGTNGLRIFGSGSHTNLNTRNLRIAYVKLYLDNTIVFDGRPYIDQNGVPGFMDSVSGNFYSKTNGTYDFIYGD